MIGRRVGRYRIVAKLGEGGMGSVWKAEDPLLGRTLALKFLPETLAASPEARRRFLREAQAASVLHHPGIATVYDAGEADGLVYIAMLLVDGSTVSDLVSGGPLPVAEAVRIAMASAGALGEAHRHGVLHRDISGRNVMVGRDGRVVVVDFGLALPEGHTRLTMTGSTMGTAAYMAPEVAQGRPADRRSDLYSLGVVLYEMLTGGPPFARDRVEAMLYATIHEAPDPPSRRRADLPGRLERIVLKALAKDPRGRYQTAEEMLADLRNLEAATPLLAEGAPSAAAEPSVSRAPTTPLPVQESVGRSRPRRVRWALPAGAGVLAAGAAAALGVLVWRGMQRPPGGAPASPYASVAVLPLKNLSQHPEESDHLADGISRALITKFTQVLNMRVIPWSTAARYSDQSRAPQEIAKELNVDALVVGTMMMAGERIACTVSVVEAKSGMQVWAEDVEVQAGDLFGVERRIAMGAATKLKGRLTGHEEEELAQPVARSAAAYELYLRGAFAMQGGGEEANSVALEFFRKAVSLDPSLAEAYVGIGAVQSDRYFRGGEGGYRSLQEAEENYRRALGLDPKLVSALGGLAEVYWEKGMSEECLKQGEAAAHLGREDVDTLFVRGQAYVLGGLPDKAVPVLRSIIAIDPANPGAHYFLTIAQTWSGHYRDAIETGGAFLSRFGDDPEVHTWIGVSSYSLGDLEQARIHYEKANDLFGEDSNFYVLIFTGTLYMRMGMADKARETWLRGIEMLKPRLDAYPDNHRMRGQLAVLYGLLGDRVMFEKEEARRPKDTPGEGATITAWMHDQLGDPTGAATILKQGLLQGNNEAFMENFRTVWGIERPLDPHLYGDLLRQAADLEKRLRARY